MVRPGRLPWALRSPLRTSPRRRQSPAGEISRNAGASARWRRRKDASVSGRVPLNQSSKNWWRALIPRRQASSARPEASFGSRASKSVVAMGACGVSLRHSPSFPAVMGERPHDGPTTLLSPCLHCPRTAGPSAEDVFNHAGAQQTGLPPARDPESTRDFGPRPRSTNL